MIDINFNNPMIRDIVYLYYTNRTSAANILISAFVEYQGTSAHQKFWCLIATGLLETADIKG